MTSGRNQEAMAFDPGMIMLETQDLKQKIDGPPYDGMWI